MNMSPHETFRRHVQRYIRQVPSPDPAVIADKILGELSDEECRAGLEATLTDYVRRVQGSMNLSIQRGHPPKTIARSGKVARARTWWADVMSTALEVGGQWKYLRDCTATDLDAAATNRYRAADRTRAQGDQWAALAAHMRKKRYKTASDVPEVDLRVMLRGAA